MNHSAGLESAQPALSPPPPSSGWASTWLDGVGFGAGLALAWWFRWNTTDLVWSLWLSSLCVGYAMIVWILIQPVRNFSAGLMAHRRPALGPLAKGVAMLLLVLGTAAGLAFFTFHFGMFHFVHSMFLGAFFPVTGVGMSGEVDSLMYREVIARYWWFLPSALLAERRAFQSSSSPSNPLGISPASLILPYKNVVRLHLLIFFFVFAHYAKIESFAVYAVVYAVYFFPWRLLRREKPGRAKPDATS